MLRIKLLSYAYAFAIVMLPVVVSGENCLDCHGQKGTPRFIDQKAFSESVHGVFACTKCHISITSYPHDKTRR